MIEISVGEQINRIGSGNIGSKMKVSNDRLV